MFVPISLSHLCIETKDDLTHAERPFDTGSKNIRMTTTTLAIHRGILERRIQRKMVRAIVSGGGCAASVAQLVLSAHQISIRHGPFDKIKQFVLGSSATVGLLHENAHQNQVHCFRQSLAPESTSRGAKTP